MLGTTHQRDYFAHFLDDKIVGFFTNYRTLVNSGYTQPQ